jgi:hypothetical protein
MAPVSQFALLNEPIAAVKRTTQKIEEIRTEMTAFKAATDKLGTSPLELKLETKIGLEAAESLTVPNPDGEFEEVGASTKVAAQSILAFILPPSKEATESKNGQEVLATTQQMVCVSFISSSVCNM